MTYTPDPDNLRVHPARNKALIRQSLEEIGGFRSIAVDGDGVVRAGNGVYEQAQALGYEFVEVEIQPHQIAVVKRPDLTGDAAKRAGFLDNVGSDSSYFDAALLDAALRESPQVVGGVLTDDELTGIIGQRKVDIGGAGDEFDTTPEEGPTRCQVGDLWAIGGVHRLLVGDCTDPANVVRLMGGERAALVVTSPPYPGADMWSEEGEEIENQIGRLNSLNHLALCAAWDAVSEGGVVCWNVQDVPFGNHGMITITTTTTTAVKEIGFAIRGNIIWDKGVPHLPLPWNMRRPCVPNITHEHILVLFKGDWIPREKQTGLDDEAKDWLAKGVWRIGTESAKAIGHKAPFPVELARRCVKLFSLENDLVLDLFLGSGTSLIAAHVSNRRCYGCEIEPKYADVILRRAEAAGLSAVRRD